MSKYEKSIAPLLFFGSSYLSCKESYNENPMQNYFVSPFKERSYLYHQPLVSDITLATGKLKDKVNQKLS